MITKRLPLIISIALCLVTTMSWGEVTYVLKDGNKVKGELVRENEDSYVVKIQLMPTIHEERIIAKSDVLRVIKPEAGTLEYQQLSAMFPASDGLKPGEYKQRLLLVNQFIEKFPTNRHIRKVMKMRDELQDELRQVEEGAVKIGGVLVGPSELRENKYELDARVKALRIEQLIEDEKYLEALRAYSDFQDEFAPTKAHLDLIPQIQEAIKIRGFEALNSLETLNSRIEQRKEGLESMKPADRQKSELAIKEQEANLIRIYSEEKAAGIDWVSVHPFSKQALDQTVKHAKAELKRIEALLAGEFTDCGDLYRQLCHMKKQGVDEKAMSEKVKIMENAGVPHHYLSQFTTGHQ